MNGARDVADIIAKQRTHARAMARIELSLLIELNWEQIFWIEHKPNDRQYRFIWLRLTNLLNFIFHFLSPLFVRFSFCLFFFFCRCRSIHLLRCDNCVAARSLVSYDFRMMMAPRTFGFSMDGRAAMRHKWIDRSIFGMTSRPEQEGFS